MNATRYLKKKESCRIIILHLDINWISDNNVYKQCLRGWRTYSETIVGEWFGTERQGIVSVMCSNPKEQMLLHVWQTDTSYRKVEKWWRNEQSTCLLFVKWIKTRSEGTYSELERSAYRLREVLILTHNLSASVIEVAHQGRLSLDRNWLSDLLSSEDGADTHTQKWNKRVWPSSDIMFRDKGKGDRRGHAGDDLSVLQTSSQVKLNIRVKGGALVFNVQKWSTY